MALSYRNFFISLAIGSLHTLRWTQRANDMLQIQNPRVNDKWQALTFNVDKTNPGQNSRTNFSQTCSLPETDSTGLSTYLCLWPRLRVAGRDFCLKSAFGEKDAERNNPLPSILCSKSSMLLMGQKSVDIFRHPIPIVHSLASPSWSRTSVCGMQTSQGAATRHWRREPRAPHQEIWCESYSRLEHLGKHSRGHKFKTTVASCDQVP